MAMLARRNRNDVAPWSPFEDLERELGRWFGENALPRMYEGGREWIPPVDIEETPDAYHVTADLPGLKKEDIHISVQDNVVTIRGERKREEKREDDNFRRYERSYGAFERSFTVHEGFDPDKIDAKYESGVLHLTLPKREESKPRQVEVKVK